MAEIDREIIKELHDSLKNQHCGFVDGVGDVYAVSGEMIKNIIALLKEQEAKTVLNAGWKAVGNNKVFYGNCPNCQRRLYAKTSNYCQYCGKKVKWE